MELGLSLPGEQDPFAAADASFRAESHMMSRLHASARSAIQRQIEWNFESHWFPQSDAGRVAFGGGAA